MKLIYILIVIASTTFLFGMGYNINYSHSDEYITEEYQEIIGLPNLKILTIKMIIPPGEEINSLTLSNIKTIEQYKHIATYTPEQTITPTLNSYNEQYSAIKSKNIGDWHVSYHNKRGVKLAVIRLTSEEYNPVLKSLKKLKSTDISVEFSKSEHGIKQEYLTNYDFYEKLTRDYYSENDTDWEYQELYNSPVSRNRNTLLIPNSKLVIVSPSDLVSTWNSYKAYKDSLGISTEVVDISDVYANYSGRDNAEKLRNCLIDLYDDLASEENQLEYVLLGGDHGFIPTRIFKIDAYYNSSLNHNNIYSDLYFAGFDGDWDNDGDNIFGEGDSSIDADATGSSGDEGDFLTEVFVGRISASTTTELTNWINKQRDYSDMTVTDDFYEKALMIGEHLGGSTYGRTAMDEIAVIMNDYTFTTLYSDEGTYSEENIIDNFNAGYGIINHLGHGSSSAIFEVNATNLASDFFNLDYPLIYSQGCHTANISVNDAIAERFIVYEKGAFAYVGNTSYGFYSSFQNQGTSQIYHREFFDALENENITVLGETFQDSKEDLIGLIQQTGTKRYIYYDNILLGDPSAEIIKQSASVEVEQYSVNQIQLSFSDAVDVEALNATNYQIYERDTPATTYIVNSVSTFGRAYLLNTADLPNGIPLEIEIINLPNLINPSIKMIQPLYTIKELSIVKPTTWTLSESPIYVYNNMIVNSLLTIESGVEIRVNSDKSFWIFNGGNMNITADDNSRVKFTSYSDIIGNGDGWTELYYDLDGTQTSSLSYVDIMNCENGLWIDSLTTINLEKVVVKNSSNYGIYSYYGNINADYLLVNQTGSAEAGGLVLLGGNHELDHVSSAYNINKDLIIGLDATVNIENSIFYDEISIDSPTVNITYSLLPETYPGVGNIVQNPLFVSETDLTLNPESPAINSGDHESTNDADNTITDMGYYYYHSPNNYTISIDNTTRPTGLVLRNTTRGSYDLIQWDIDNDGIWDTETDSVTVFYSSEDEFSIKMKLTKGDWSQEILKSNVISSSFTRIYTDVNPSININETTIAIDWEDVLSSDYYLLYQGTYPGEYNRISTQLESSYEVELDIENKLFYHVIPVEQEFEINE